MTSATFLEIEEYRPRPALFSMRGRLGRSRWVLYGIGAICGTFMFMWLAGYSMYLGGQLGRLVYQLLFYAVYYFALPIFLVQLTIRRAHDFNMEGWLALLLLVPVLNLVFGFIPGSRGENNYGPQLEAEALPTRIAAIALPLLLVATFLGAKTIPPADQEKNPKPVTTHPAKPIRPYIP